MVSHGLRTSWPEISCPMFQKLSGAGMSNIDFLTADVILFLSDVKTTFSQRVATDLKKVFGSRTKSREDV